MEFARCLILIMRKRNNKALYFSCFKSFFPITSIFQTASRTKYLNKRIFCPTPQNYVIILYIPKDELLFLPAGNIFSSSRFLEIKAKASFFSRGDEYMLINSCWGNERVEMAG